MARMRKRQRREVRVLISLKEDTEECNLKSSILNLLMMNFTSLENVNQLSHPNLFTWPGKTIKKMTGLVALQRDKTKVSNLSNPSTSHTQDTCSQLKPQAGVFIQIWALFRNHSRVSCTEDPPMFKVEIGFSEYLKNSENDATQINNFLQL